MKILKINQSSFQVWFIFLGSLSKLSRGLTYLNLSKTGLTGKGINKLAETMCASSVIRNSLQTLKISDNPVKGDEVTVSSFFFFFFLSFIFQEPCKHCLIDMALSQTSIGITLLEYKMDPLLPIWRVYFDRSTSHSSQPSWHERKIEWKICCCYEIKGVVDKQKNTWFQFLHSTCPLISELPWLSLALNSIAPTELKTLLIWYLNYLIN